MTDPRPTPSPFPRTSVVIGIGVVVVAVISTIAGALSDNFAGTFGRVATIGMIVVALAAVLAAVWPSMVARRKRS